MFMVQAPLPTRYTGASDEEVAERIDEARAKLGEKLVILGHHYQRDEIIRHADYRGDSYKLAKDAQNHPDAEFIMFCGVHFMAESADILTPDHQKVILPNMAAGCSMADMANQFQVKACWRQLSEIMDVSEIVPITYINSAATLKAFVGERDGTVCTSSNASKAVKWALARGQKVFFAPDQHLGRNTAVAMGFKPIRDTIVWDPFRPLGGNLPEDIKKARFILWKGHCSVHQRFTVEQIASARAEFPDIKVVVHPECSLEVVKASDYNGSTESIIKIIEDAPSGSTWGIGTEINLVKRLANENPDKTIFCLDPHVCPCSTMYRIHPSFLLYALEKLVAGEVINQIKVKEPVRSQALVALKHMLEI